MKNLFILEIIKKNKTYLAEFLLLVLAIAIVLFAGTYRLSESPRFWYDEGIYAQVAMNLAEYGRQAIQVAPGEFVSTGTVTSGYPLFYPVAAAYKLFGVGVAEGRFAMVAFMVFLLIAAYLFIRFLFGVRYALWAAFLLSTFPMLYGNGRGVMGEVPGIFFLLLSFIALFALEKSGWNNLLAYGFFGIASGLCLSTKPIFVLLLPALVITYLFYRKYIHVRWTGFIIAASFFVVEIFWWLYLQFGVENSFKEIISYYSNPYEVMDMWVNIIHNISLFFTDTTPIFSMMLLVIWAGVLILRYKKGEKIVFTESVAFVFSLLILLAFLRMEAFYRYIFPATIIVFIFFPYSGLYLFNRVQEYLPTQRWLSCIPPILLAALVIFDAYQLGFSSFIANYYENHQTRDVGMYFASFDKDKKVFVYDAPELVIYLPSRNYHQYIYPHQNANYGGEQLSILEKGEADIVILSADRYKTDTTNFPKYNFKAKVRGYVVLEKL